MKRAKQLLVWEEAMGLVDDINQGAELPSTKYFDELTTMYPGRSERNRIRMIRECARKILRGSLYALSGSSRSAKG